MTAFEKNNGSPSSGSNNISNSQNTQNTQRNVPMYSNTPNSSVNTPFNPMMYYYQPFNPYGGYPGYQMPMYMPTSVQMQMNMSTPMQIPMNVNMNMQNPGNNTTNNAMNNYKPVNQHSNKLEPKASEPQAKKDQLVKSDSKPQLEKPSSSNSGGYNLDDPVELEKWKAERRKRFPSANKITSDPVDNKVEEKDIKSGVLDDKFDESNQRNDQNSPKMKKNRFCKYFARGKCNKGDGCPFEHGEKQPPSSAKRAKVQQTKMTVFENLLQLEEKEDMLKFYECIKILTK